MNVSLSQPERRRMSWLVDALPRLGTPGSRSAELHNDRSANPRPLNYFELRRFVALRWLGTTGTLLMGLGALGAGAFPVINNPYPLFPAGDVMARMLSTSSIVTLIGVGCLVLAWVLMAPFVSTIVALPLSGAQSEAARVDMRMLRRTFIAWVLPLSLTAPLFTQDIYSYLAQGSIVAHGMDPYAAGPVDILGPDNVLARSVPFIWAHSPSPYGPVALMFAAIVSELTNDSIFLGVLGHRLLSIVGLACAGWGVVKLAGRCHVSKQAAMWLGILNPLCMLHLIGGIHNESIMLGFTMAGIELALRGVDRLRLTRWTYLIVGGALISCGGLVKVTGFIALGFVGMALARSFRLRGTGAVVSLIVAVVVQLLILAGTVAAVTALSGIGLGWITGQGGAATIRSWMSISTDVGVIAGVIGGWLGLGDHTDAILQVTRGFALLVAGAFMLRMLFAVFWDRIHPLGGLGASMFVMVVLFPVVHPWYLLWAIVPLAAWANRPLFRILTVFYSSIMSFFVLPRGLRLPADTVLSIYVGAALIFAVLLGAMWWLLRRTKVIGLN